MSALLAHATAFEELSAALMDEAENQSVKPKDNPIPHVAAGVCASLSVSYAIAATRLRSIAKLEASGPAFEERPEAPGRRR